jgi:glycosyltransferase involved in cell wall biosynthesis
VDETIKVFVIGPRGFPDVQGGIEKFSEGLYPRLAAQGHKITTFAIKRYCTHKSWKGIQFVYVPAPKNKSLEKLTYNFFTAIYCIVKRPDIVHVHSIASGFFIFLMKLSGLKIIARYNSRDYLHGKWNPLGKMVLKFSERQFFLADHIMVNNKNYLAFFRESGRTDRLSYIPNGITIYPGPGEKNCAEVFSLLGVEKRNYILSVGRLTQEKNFDLLIKAFLKLNLPDTKLLIAGEAAHKDNYADSLIKKYANVKNIIFAGKVNRVTLNCLYAHSLLFVFPSLFEGMPNVLLEAMSFNCKILLSDIPPHLEFELGNESYFKVESEADLHEKMKNKLKLNEKCNYEYILKRHNWDIIAQQVLSVYKEVLMK